MTQGIKIAVIVFILTIIVVIANPKIDKSVSITSSSDVAVKNVYQDVETKDLKFSNKNSFKDTQINGFNNIDNLKNTDSKLKNIDNLSNKNNLSAENKSNINSEDKFLAELKRRNALPEQPVEYEFKSKNFGNNQPKIVLDENYQENPEPKVLIQEPKKELNNQQIVLNENYMDYDEQSKSKKTRVRTKYEETIIWNKWKSDLHNQIHNDIAYSLPDDMPLGAMYKYSFVIDKYGKVSDIDVKIVFSGLAFDDSNREALKEGIKVFRDAIENCGKRHFAGFPKGSQRQSVKLELMVQMGFVNVYTNPADFNDMEKVLRFR